MLLDEPGSRSRDDLDLVAVMACIARVVWGLKPAIGHVLQFQAKSGARL